MTVTYRIIETEDRGEGKGFLYGPVYRGPEMVKMEKKGPPAYGFFKDGEWYTPNCFSVEDARQKAEWIVYMFDKNPDYIPNSEDQRKKYNNYNILDISNYKRQSDRFLQAIDDGDSDELLFDMAVDLRRTVLEIKNRLGAKIPPKRKPRDKKLELVS